MYPRHSQWLFKFHNLIIKHFNPYLQESKEMLFAYLLNLSRQFKGNTFPFTFLLPICQCLMMDSYEKTEWENVSITGSPKLQGRRGSTKNKWLEPLRQTLNLKSTYQKCQIIINQCCYLNVVSYDLSYF